MRVFASGVGLLFCLAASGPAMGAPIGIGDSDRVVFYGDKMVEPAKFGHMVESFIRVKYPESKARFWHVGSRNHDKIELANEQFDERLAPLKPTIIVLCWGLGDGGMKKHRDERVAQVAGHYGTLIDRCKKLGAKVFVLTPPCPTIAKKNILAAGEYDVTVMKIAEAISKTAGERGVTVLDWYGPTAALHEQGKGAELTDKDGLFPAASSNAIAAKLIFDAWHLEPIDVRVQMDWAAGTASTTHGSAEVIGNDPNAKSLNLQDFPMPFHTGKRKAAFREDFACADYCRMTLTVDNLPDGIVAMRQRGTRQKPMSVSSQQLRSGLNLAAIKPITRTKRFTDFVDKIETKNNYAFKIRAFKKQYIENQDIDPELVASYQTHLLALQQFHEGIAQVILRTPRTLNLALDLRLAPGGSRP